MVRRNITLTIKPKPLLPIQGQSGYVAYIIKILEK